ncbi:PfkB family carbohydrate kinase [Candidatus Margulisiibacteriota bacterium]
MILTVTLNPAFDHLLFLDEVYLSKLNRARKTIRIPGGKGVNVASTLAMLGDEVVATGFLGAQGSRMFEEPLRKIGVTTGFIYVSQEIRTDFFVIEEHKKRQSLIVEKGIPIELRYLNSFKSNFERLLASADLVEIGGSLPSGVSTAFLREIVSIANKKKVKVVLNLNEEMLNEVMPGTASFLIYPDLRENKKMFNEDIYKPNSRKKIIEQLLNFGVKIVLLKYGNLNYLVATENELWEGEIELGETSIMIGIRDAVLAGFMHKYLESNNLGEALKYGLGCGCSAAKNQRNYPNSKKEAEELLLGAKVRKVS